MSEPLTVKVIGAKGAMGREHATAWKAAGARIIHLGDPHVVSVASPDNTHANYVIDALKKGAHVFCEKPLCTTRLEYNMILDLKRENQAIVWQHFPLRYQQIFKDMKKAVRGFGDIYRVEASYNWGRTEKLFEAWRKDDDTYSLVLGGMIHMIDLVQWVTGLEINGVNDTEYLHAVAINSVKGVNIYDNVSVQSTIGKHGLCVLGVDGGYGVKRHNHRLTVHGTEGGRCVVNHEPSDKRLMIRDFVQELQKDMPQSRGIQPTSVAIAIDEWVKAGQEKNAR